MEEIESQLSGLFQSGQAFCRMRYEGRGVVVPVTVQADSPLEDLLHIECQKSVLLNNLQRFLEGEPCDHMLLWGARGTGKSSLIRAAYHALRPRGLKLLQIACDDLHDLAFFLWVIAKQESKFLLYIDDLSFARGDGSYRALKAVLDGSIAGMPENVRLCVTSNRRHLLDEVHHDDRSIHPEEDVEEQISLAERFGLRLSFHPLSQKQYLEVARHWMRRSGRKATADFDRLALRFALAHGSRSARVARQFVRQASE